MVVSLFARLILSCGLSNHRETSNGALLKSSWTDICHLPRTSAPRAPAALLPQNATIAEICERGSQWVETLNTPTSSHVCFHAIPLRPAIADAELCSRLLPVEVTGLRTTSPS